VREDLSIVSVVLTTQRRSRPHPRSLDSDDFARDAENSLSQRERVGVREDPSIASVVPTTLHRSRPRPRSLDSADFARDANVDLLRLSVPRQHNNLITFFTEFRALEVAPHFDHFEPDTIAQRQHLLRVEVTNNHL